MNIPSILYCSGRCPAIQGIQSKFRKPILLLSRYSGCMNTTQKSYRFCIEPDDPIATLEAVLAIVRRLGIELRGLRTAATAQGVDVQLRLAAPEEDPLTLCRMRLHNVIGVLAIREMPSLVASPESCAVSLSGRHI
jgi:acetolactate synthase regulatory subunit